VIKRSALLALVVANALICSAAAATLSHSDELARDAALQWLRLIDAGQYEEAAAQASQEVRAFEQWMNRLKTQRAALGRASKRQFAELKRTSMVSGIPEVRRYTVIRFRTSFERKFAATELVTIAKIGCCWEIFEYKISDQ
jgi:hypothetical protein